MDVHASIPRLIPVIDVLGGKVVRAIAGNRKEYKPLVSRLTDSTEPVVVARALCNKCRTNDLYVADLDAINTAKPSSMLHGELAAAGFRCWLDAGIRTLEDAQSQAEAMPPESGVLVTGLETVNGRSELRRIVEALGSSRVAFSLDLRDGQPIGDPAAWSPKAQVVADIAIDAGITRIIVLDLARVGVRVGVGTESLCASLKSRHPEVELIAGGGIRGAEDLDRLHSAGVSAALVASSLHDLRLNPDDLRI
jgi:phosphoribosylformimino-5-aminoimidazole carboxamide ribotide isomerase